MVNVSEFLIAVFFVLVVSEVEPFTAQAPFDKLMVNID